MRVMQGNQNFLKVIVEEEFYVQEKQSNPNVKLCTKNINE